jgi:hypothetical protein
VRNVKGLLSSLTPESLVEYGAVQTIANDLPNTTTLNDSFDSRTARNLEYQYWVTKVKKAKVHCLASAARLCWSRCRATAMDAPR